MTHPRTVRSRISRITGTVLAAALLLTGCAGTGTPAATDATDAPAATGSLLPPAEGKTEYPLTLKTAWGETTLEKRPERVAVLDVNSVAPDIVLSLGVTPVAANQGVGTYSYLADAGGADVEYLLEGDEDSAVSLEAVAAAKPDLIIAPTWDLTDEWKDLTRIAPVLGSPEKQDDYANGNSWKELAPWIGEDSTCKTKPGK